MGVTHVALDLRPGSQRGHRVHHHHVDGAGADQSLTDLQSLFAGVGLGDEHGVDIHAQSPGVAGVQGVLGVDESHLAPPLLGLRQDVEGQRGLTGGLGAVDLDDAALGDAADTQGDVQRQRTGGDGLHHDARVLPQTHDGALAVGPLDLGHAGLDGFLLIRRGGRRLHGGLFRCHNHSSFPAPPIRRVFGFRP